MKKIIALFGYPMDNSVRAKVFDNMPDVEAERLKWKEICYLVVAFECDGEILILGDDNEVKKV